MTAFLAANFEVALFVLGVACVTALTILGLAKMEGPKR